MNILHLPSAGLSGLLVLLLSAPPLPAAGLWGRLQVKISGGIITSGDGDIAGIIRGMEDYHRDLATMWGKTKTGALDWPREGWALGGEVEMALTRRVGLCLSLDSFLKNKDASLRLTPDPWMAVTGHCRVSAAFLSLSGVYRFPLDESAQVFLKGGPSFAWMGNEVEYRLESGNGWWEEKTAGIRDAAFGLQAGAGVEYRISKTLSLTAEGLWRWTKFSSWTGEYDRVNSDGRTDHISGPVWLEEVMWQTGKYYPEAVIGNKDVPHPTRTVRAFQVGFSGLVFKVGLKVALGR